jgi:septal ring factor EnvC (AmiA/AmiB activator)
VATLAVAQGMPSPEDARKRLENDRAQLEATKRRAKELEEDLQEIDGARACLRGRMIKNGRQIRQSDAALLRMEARLSALAVEKEQMLEKWLAILRSAGKHALAVKNINPDSPGFVVTLRTVLQQVAEIVPGVRNEAEETIRVMDDVAWLMGEYREMRRKSKP